MSLAASFALVFWGLYAIHAVPPAQIEAGALAQKIFYFHVASAWVAFLAFLIAACYGVAHLVHESGGDVPSICHASRCYAAIEVGFVFCTCVLISGPIWARPVWGVWWRWEPRLTTFLILWTMYAACCVMHASIERAPVRDRLISVYSVIAALGIPVVYASVLFWRPEAQFHPARIHLDEAFVRPLWISMAALTALFVALWQTRSRILFLEEECS